MKNMLKLGLILTAYSLVACVGLAFVYAGTKTVIAERAQADLEASLRSIFPAADEFAVVPPAELASPLPAVGFSAAYRISAAGALAGIALKTAGPSYGGATTALVGVGVDRRIAGVRILENKDTPGLGANAVSPNYYVDRAAKTTFAGQFAGMASDAAFRVKDDVVAITASTITSTAVANIVKAAGAAGAAWLAAQGGN